MAQGDAEEQFGDVTDKEWDSVPGKPRTRLSRWQPLVRELLEGKTKRVPYRTNKELRAYRIGIGMAVKSQNPRYRIEFKTVPSGTGEGGELWVRASL
jgi:hypothetical protein